MSETKAKEREQSRAAARRLVGLAQIYRGAFATELGRKALDDLRTCYGGSTLGGTARETEIRAAQRDVLMRIEDLIEIASSEPDGAIEDLARHPEEVAVRINPWRKYADR